MTLPHPSQEVKLNIAYVGKDGPQRYRTAPQLKKPAYSGNLQSLFELWSWPGIRMAKSDWFAVLHMSW